MSTVLEKPVLLDETGQEIVDKLDEIKSAISSGGEYIPLAIRITTPPTKVSYYDGDALDLSGIVVSLVGSNGSLIDVTSACTFSPANGATLSTSDTSVAITYHYDKDNVDFTTSQEITVAVVAPVSIAVTTPPIKTDYLIGDTLDLTGMVVTATYNNGTTSNVTSSCTYSPADGTTLTSEDIDIINITYAGLSTTQEILVSNPIYGAEWDGTAASTWTRTDMAALFTDPSPAVNNGNGQSPFDNILPWSGMERVEDPEAGTLVKIPKFYYKWTRDGAKMKVQISPFAQDGFYTSPAHADRGDGQGERDVVYVGAYHCATSTYKSATGAAPQINITRANFRTNIHNLGSTIWQYDYAMFWTIAMLYLVEYADWNSQAKIGYGCGNNSSIENNGLTDSMTYHTGTNAANRATYGHVRYRYIEGLWDNVVDFCDGFYFGGIYAYAIKNPSNFSDTTGGTSLGSRLTNGGYISGWTNPDVNGFEYALYPNARNGTADTYVCDYSDNNTSGVVLLAGGSYSQSQSSGLFQLWGSYGASSKNNEFGARLMKLPNNS